MGARPAEPAPASLKIAGIGVDVVGIGRLKRVRGRTGRLMEHVTSEEERVGGVDDLRAAELWTGKEAVAKAVGTGFWQAGVGWADVRLTRDHQVTLHGAAARLAPDSTFALNYSRDGDRLIAVAFRWVTDHSSTSTSDSGLREMSGTSQSSAG